MLIDTCQRLTEGRTTRRPAGEIIQTRAYDVEEIDRSVAAAFVEKHHYAHSCGSRSHTFGLFERGALSGVAVFGALPSMNAHRHVFGALDTRQGVTLGRLVLLEHVPGNGESWFIARCFELLRTRGVVAVESCADPVRGHLGIIYQATNGYHVGRTRIDTRYLLPDGTDLSIRGCSKLTSGERGAGRVVEQLLVHGADPPEPGADAAAWLATWRARLTRRYRHPGNFRYLWCLDKQHRRDVLGRFQRQPYPKMEAR